jgi:hypothetical protein
VDVIDTILPILGANQFWVKNASNTAIIAATISGSAGTGTVNLGTQNQLAWYATSGTAVSGLGVGATNSMLTTNSSGVPTWATSIAPTSILDANGNVMVGFTATPSAVNYIQITNNATGHAPAVGSAGADSAIPLLLSNKNSYTYFIDSTATAGGQIRLYNAAITQYTGFKVATAQATSILFTVPAADGTANAPLITDGAGNLSFLPGAWSTWTPTYTGFSGTPTTNIARYKQIGKTVFVDLDMSGTSNATGFAFTLPVTGGALGITFAVGRAVDNSAYSAQVYGAVGSGGATSGAFVIGDNGSGWTNSGTKGVRCSFFYESA